MDSINPKRTVDDRRRPRTIGRDNGAAGGNDGRAYR
jgi:hypothetical protein